jgi:hypothetical protein
MSRDSRIILTYLPHGRISRIQKAALELEFSRWT